MTTCTQTADLKAKLFRGFSDPSRLSILNTLRQGPLTVSEIVQQTGLSQSNVSNHLSCLRCCDLVVREQQGRFMYYELADVRIAKLLDLADELLADVAKGVRQCSHYQKDSTGRAFEN
ncbi:ArsR/SmtB family transcription factor [Aerosakkonemataceae cyanobacterium BLCC-F154]|uniref:ArsR/SmtB family transcription factor n=1 Tax=Floridaenema fluviatile BLCC-F154 TaxID=3153640 RepID=A0ABV4YFW0_9CYAN